MGNGSVFEVAAQMNDVSYKSCCGITSQSTGDSSFIGLGSKLCLKNSLLVFSSVFLLLSTFF